MNNEIQQAYINALLADAVYIASNPPVNAKEEDTLNGRMTDKQAAFINQHFKRINSYETGDLDVVVWQGISGVYANKHYVSFRGTAGAKDIFTDIDLFANSVAREQIRDTINWWLKNTTPKGEMAPQVKLTRSIDLVTHALRFFVRGEDVEGTGLLSDVQSVQVNGHSLGGHLSAAFARLFADKIQSVVTFNSAGFIGSSELIFKNLESVLNLGHTQFHSNHNNYFAEHGVNITTNDWWFKQVGQRKGIFNEEDAIRIDANHSMYKLTDTLALGNVLATIDDSLTIKQLNELLNAYAKLNNGKEADATLETVLDAVRKIFLGKDIQDTPISDSGDYSKNREDYHKNISELLQKIQPNTSKLLLLSSPETVKMILQQALKQDELGLAYRYALKNLNLFAISNHNYDEHNQNGELDLYSPQNPNGMTETYIKKRVEMLSVLVDKNIDTTITYRDLELNISSIDEEAFEISIKSQVIFGTDNNDAVEKMSGKNGDDYLFGGFGNDSLKGGKGNDYMEGGKGFDKYYIADTDVIFDNDMQGKVIFNQDENIEFKFNKNNVNENRWYSVDENNEKDGRFFAVRHLSDLIIKQYHDQDTVTIRDFFILAESKNDVFTGLNITLNNVPQEQPEKGKLWVGDSRPLLDSNGNYKDEWNKRDVITGKIIGGVDEENFNDMIQSDNQDGIIKGLGGHDALSGGTGNDIIEGGDGFDMLLGGGGEDTIRGGDGNDFIDASSKLGSELHRIRPTDTWVSPSGTAYTMLSGSLNSLWGVYKINSNNRIVFVNAAPVVDDVGDTIFGGNGDDIVFGSNHDDYIHGDGYRLSEDGKNIIYESGDDDLRGRGGHDTIYGGLGDDKIWGDSADISPDLHGMDVLYGDKGKDEIVGGGKDDILYGGDGNDHIQGDDSPRLLDGQYHGNDVLYGGAGEDRLVGHGGHDTLDGGEDNDILWGDSSNSSNPLDGKYHGNDTLYGGSGNDELYGNGGSDELDGGEGDDTLLGDTHMNLLDGQYHGIDILYGGGGNDKLMGYGKNDILDGGEGDDFLWGDAFTDYLDAQHHGNDTLYGGNGHDQITGNGGDDIMYGGTGNDMMWGDSNQFVNGETLEPELIGNDRLYGEEGDDKLYGGLGDDYLSGGMGMDTLLGDVGNDILLGDEGNDILFGNGGNDTLFGGGGDDQIHGDEDESQTKDWSQSFDDILYGEDGNDTLVGGSGSDILYGGSGNDTLFAGMSVIQNTNQFVPSHLVGNDILYGGAGNDILYGDNGDTSLYGNEGIDRLISFAGNDELYGGADNDYLESGKGTDYLVGGEDIDVYRYKHHDGITTIDDLQGGNIIILDTLDNLSIESYEDGLVIYNGIEGDKLYLVGYTMNQDNLPDVLLTIPEYINHPDKYVSLFHILDKQDNSHYVNQAPVHAKFIPNWTLTENQEGVFVLPEDLFVDDLDRNLNYSIRMSDGSNLPAWLDYRIGGTEMVARPDFDAAGVYQLKIIATDSAGLSNSIDWQIEVQNQNRAPTVSGSLNTQNLKVGENWQYTLPIKFNDADTGETEKLAYHLAMADGSAVPSWLSYNDKTQTLSGKAEVSGSLNVNIVATDPYGEQVIAPISLNIQDLPQPVTPPTTTKPVTTTPVLGVNKQGLFGNDVLSGTDGNDTLYGGRGHGKDTLIGGKGDDYLMGGAGNDTYIFNVGDGNDRIYDSGGKDILKINGLTLSDVLFQRDGRDLIIQSTKGNDSITIEQYYFSDKPNVFLPNLINPVANVKKIDVVQFDNGQSLTYQQIDRLVQFDNQPHYAIL